MSGITMYDISKQVASNEPPMDPIIFNQAMLGVAADKELLNATYLMLLCNDRRDYSIFHLTHEDSLSKKFAVELAETLCNRGKTLFVDKQSDGSYEIWIRDELTNENFAYYLFNYDEGIIEV